MNRATGPVSNLWITAFHNVENGPGCTNDKPPRGQCAQRPASILGPSRGLLALWITCAYVDKPVHNPVDIRETSKTLNGPIPH